jgi:hypothetical protein
MSLGPDTDDRSKSRTRCLAEQRSKLRAAAEHLNGDPTVRAVDIVPPTATETGDHALELTVGPDEHVRPTLLQTIAAHGLDLDSCEPMAAHTHRRVVLRPR